MISYEVSLSIILMSIIIIVGSLNLIHIVNFQENLWLVFPLFPLFLLFFISSLAESNRTPFDLPEAEGEIVAGYNVEYSSVIFTLFYISEYGNIILLSTLNTIFFFGGWNMPFFIVSTTLAPLVLALKTLCLIFIFIWIRASFPRYRYDMLMRLGWKVFLPISLGFLVFFSGILLAFDGCPSIIYFN
jgi:NADH-quinone oxidoreductase subunit H